MLAPKMEKPLTDHLTPFLGYLSKFVVYILTAIFIQLSSLFMIRHKDFSDVCSGLSLFLAATMIELLEIYSPGLLRSKITIRFIP